MNKMISKYMSRIGKKGGAKNKQKGRGYFVKIGKLGGRPSKKFLKDTAKVRKFME